MSLDGGRRILVTGGSGFVGCHVAAELHRRGERVRVLARSRDRVAMALPGVGLDPRAIETVLADVTDETAVADAMRDCDGVVHAAAQVSHDPRKARAVYRVNVRGAENVFASARRLGIGSIVHVSTIATMLPHAGTAITPDSPLGDPPFGYLRSKVAIEALARRLQDEGVPLVVMQPGLLAGPGDPKLGSGDRLVRDVVSGQMPVVPKASLPVGDIRDFAAAVAQAATPGRVPARYVTGGAYVSFEEVVELLAAITGQEIRCHAVSARIVLGIARVADVLQRVVPKEMPITASEVWIAAQDPRPDDSRAAEELGFSPRDLRTTLADTVASLERGGHLQRAA